MIAPEFNEATFQDRAFDELVDRYGAAIIGVPRTTGGNLPERDLGFDAMCRIRVGGRVKPVFIQYKTARLAVQIGRDRPCWDHFGGPYFRFGLHRDSRAKDDPRLPPYRQHNLLVRLRDRWLAFYAAPRFHTNDDLTALYHAARIHDHTFFGDPAVIGPLYDNDPHHVSYALTGRRWARHSEFVPLEDARSFDEVLISAEAEDFDESRLRELAERLAEEVEQTYDDEMRRRAGVGPTGLDEVPSELPQLVDWTSQIVRDEYGSALALVPIEPWGAREFRLRWPDAEARAPW